jgi:hypothetical protein
VNWEGLNHWQQWALGTGGSLAATLIVWLCTRLFRKTGKDSEPERTMRVDASPVMTQNFQPTINIIATPPDFTRDQNHADERVSETGITKPLITAAGSPSAWQDISDQDISQARKLYEQIIAGSATLLCKTNLIYRYHVNVPAVEMLLGDIVADAGGASRLTDRIDAVTVERFIGFVERTGWRNGCDWETPNVWIGEDGTPAYSGMTDHEWLSVCADGQNSPVEQLSDPKSLIGSISWYDAAAFCSERQSLAKLPTIEELVKFLNGRSAKTHWFWSCEWFDREKAHVCVARRGEHGIEKLGLNPDLRNPKLGFAVIQIAEQER